MTTHSQRLRDSISLVRGQLDRLIRGVWFHPRLGERFPEFLFAMYGITVASAPAMRTAAACCANLADDPLAAWLCPYYLEHAGEESGHEQWLLDDLATFGVARDQVMRRLPYPSVAALVGVQYYWMHHVHPVAYLGYIAVVEEPASIEFLEETSRRTGIALSSMSGHVMHARLDPDHVAEFDAALDGLPLTAHHRDLISVSAIATVAHLENVFTDILQHFERVDDPASAANLFTASRIMSASAPRVL
ncbi:MAG: iron-containing redox enzyme family protein [Acidobacteriota bacterium]